MPSSGTCILVGIVASLLFFILPLPARPASDWPLTRECQKEEAAKSWEDGFEETRDGSCPEVGNQNATAKDAKPKPVVCVPADKPSDYAIVVSAKTDRVWKKAVLALQ